MGVWLQQDLSAEAKPAAASRVALALLGGRGEEGLEPVLSPPVPAVDACVRLPGSVRARDLVAGRSPAQLAGYENLLWLRPGERLLVGNQAHLLRRAAQGVKGACFLPVHYPLPSGLTLLTIEPRWVRSGSNAQNRPGFVTVPIVSRKPPAAETPADRQDLTWALLYRAVRLVLTGDRDAGLAQLDHLYQRVEPMARPIAALVVRNGLAAVLDAGVARVDALSPQGKPGRSAPGQQALRGLERWVERARGYPSDPELRLLLALIPYASGDVAAAADELTNLVENPPHRSQGDRIEGGGAASYRVLYFRGRAFARQGALDRAVRDWGAALKVNPDYLEPLAELTRHRLHADVLDRLGMRRFWRGRTREAVSLVVRAYAQSDEPAVAHGILAAIPDLPLPAELKRRLGRGAPSPSARPARTRGVRWEGPFFVRSSLSRVNEQLALRLIRQGHGLCAIPTEPYTHDPYAEQAALPLARSLWREMEQTGVTVRHRWPPSFAPVREGRLVVVLPWEYGAVPHAWVDGLKRADEIWVYARSVRDGLLPSGLEPERIQVVPCGFDPRVFHPAPPGSGPVRQGFRFLYVGGTISRKGYDLALEAFLAEFAQSEPVALTIKDFGSTTFYRTASGVARVRAAARATRDLPRRVELIDRLLTDEELAALYQSANALVAPYRGEGFCLPALEAMACGTPAILPRFGPALDYATDETAMLLDAELRSVGTSVSGMALSGEGLLCEIPLEALRKAMRWAVEHRDLLEAMGRRAAQAVHAAFTWDHAAAKAGERLRALGGCSGGSSHA